MRLKARLTLESAEGAETLALHSGSAAREGYKSSSLVNRVSAPSAISGFDFSLLKTLRLPLRLCVSAVNLTPPSE